MSESETESTQSENVAAGEINRLEQTPGFILPDEKGQLLKDVNMPEYKRLCGLRDAAYERSRDFQNANPVETPEAQQSVIEKTNQATKELEAAGFRGEALADQFIESGRDITSELGIEQLRADLQREIEQVSQLFPDSNIDIDAEMEEPTVERLGGFKQMRLVGEENYESLKPLIISDMTALGETPEKIEMARMFLASAKKGDGGSKRIARAIVQAICTVKEDRSAGEFDID